MKKLLKSSLIFLPLLILIFTVNYYVDPASLLNKSAEKEIAAAFLDGHNVSDVTTIDDRAMIEYYFGQRTEKLDCIVLGASRGMQISAETTGIEHTFNAGVTGAEFRDIVSIYYMYRSKLGVPENVILVLEPWTISEKYVNKRCITEGYYDFCEKNGLTAFRTNNIRVQLEKYFEMFTIRYFQQSINPLFQGDFNLRKEVIITDEIYGDADIRHADGRYAYSNQYMNSGDSYKRTAAADSEIKVPDFIKDYKYNAELEKQLRAFVKEMKDDGADVTIFIPPVLPRNYTFFMENEKYSQCFIKSWEIYEDIARENNIEIIGNYCDDNLSAEDFYDTLHPTYEYVYDLFEEYRENKIYG